MARISSYNQTTAAQIADEIQALIDKADEQNASPEFIAGLETALAVLSGSYDARPEELQNAEA